MNDLAQLQRQVDESFRRAFGRTPLQERLRDLLSQALGTTRYTDLGHLREEAGDLLCSVLQLFTECQWDPADAVLSTLEKIEKRRLQYQSLGRKTTVALLGGAFDPIANGHIAVAQFVLDTSRTFDEVWLLPCFSHMLGKQMAPAEHRLEMCRQAAAVDGRIKVFDFEIERRFRGETYFFVKNLLDDEIAQRNDFSLIIGQDNANSFSSWPHSAELERMIRFVVVPRRGSPFELGQAWYLKPPHIYLAAGEPLVQTRSTIVRQMLKAGDSAVKELVDPGVLEYIEQNRLYRAVDSE